MNLRREPKKHLSGCQKRNNKKRKDKLNESQKGAMNKFVLRKEPNQNSEQLYITNGEEQPDQTENVVEENGLAMCCIERNMLDSVDLDIIIDDFA